jgi:hypothetical protein
MKLKDWLPPLGCRATWMEPGRFSDREAVLAAALDTLVFHDNAADRRENCPNCVELQHAMEVLNAIAGEELGSRAADDRPPRPRLAALAGASRVGAGHGPAGLPRQSHHRGAPRARHPASDHRLAALRAGRHAVVIDRARALSARRPKTRCA